jgi:hypothetical protein
MSKPDTGWHHLFQKDLALSIFTLKTSGAYTIKLFTAIIYGRKRFYSTGPWSHIHKTTVS